MLQLSTGKHIQRENRGSYKEKDTAENNEFEALLAFGLNFC